MSEHLERPAYVLSRPGRDALDVAGLSLSARWRAALGQLGARVIGVGLEELLAGLRGAKGPVLLADGGTVVEQSSLDTLAKATPADDEIVTLMAEGLPPAPVAILGPAAARSLADGLAWDDLGDELQRLQKEGVLRVRAVEHPDPFWRTVRDRRDARSAGWRLLRRLRLRPGGLAARGVNRHVSTVISYFLLKTPVTPNIVTVFTMLSGLASAWLMSLGGYWAALGGAALMQFSSIVDGCDGEIARMRYQSSEWGAWFDSIADEIVNALFLVAVGCNLTITWGQWPWLVMGIFAGAVSFLYATVHWHSKHRYGVGMYWWFDRKKFDAGASKQEIWESKSLMRYLKMLLWRDSFLLIYLVAAATWYLLPAMLVLSTGGAAATLVMLFIHIVIKRAQW